MGEGYSRSTYDGYGAGSINSKSKVVDDGISLHRTMVWLRFFCDWSKKYGATTKSDHSCSAGHSRTLQSSKKKKENPCLGMTVQTSSPGGCGCDGGGTNHYPLSLPDNFFLSTNSHVDVSRIVHYFVYL